ncbi:MAG: hypothetical protein M3222_02515 [Thermoproteota archaeon]|jgi:hypothetical protein|nr:hypothetical protein [Thermoproteota archaeon]MDQ4022910.1 hypothetical protein [Thermoproteota archaeon]
MASSEELDETFQKRISEAEAELRDDTQSLNLLEFLSDRADMTNIVLGKDFALQVLEGDADKLERLIIRLGCLTRNATDQITLTKVGDAVLNKLKKSSSSVSPKESLME